MKRKAARDYEDLLQVSAVAVVLLNGLTVAFSVLFPPLRASCPTSTTPF
jgi:hypothetical protein